MPIYTVYGDLASMVRVEPCRGCGGHGSFNQGGATPGRGSFRVCDDCALIDGCRVIEHDPVIEEDVSLGMKRAARCSCGWFIGTHHPNDDGDWVPWTDDELADVVADHIIPRHSSHWGCYPHAIADCDRLHKAREKRRANYLRKANP